MNLIERLQDADGPSRELDAEIARLLDLPWNYAVEWPSDEPVAFPYTSSIDVALTLVPEGWGVDLEIRASVAHVYMETDENEAEAYNVATPALAICIAALKARYDQS